MAILNPATGKQIAAVPDGSRADVDRAVQAAKTAFYDGRWSRKTPGERSLALFRLADLLEQHGAEIGRVESENAGKPYAQLTMAGDIPFAVDNLRFFAAAARDTHGSRAGEFAAGYTSMFRREPVGVVGQIAPWNYPLLMAVWKLGPALAAGCTVVLKPAPTTPLTRVDAGRADPAGRHPRRRGQHRHRRQRHRPGAGRASRMCAWSASPARPPRARRSWRRPPTRSSASTWSWAARPRSSSSTMPTSSWPAPRRRSPPSATPGQDCTAATRVYVEKSRYNDTLEAVVEAMRGVKVGMPFDDDTAMGPVISDVQRQRVLGFIERAKAGGARIVTGGGVPKGFDGGFFVEPTVIVDADQKSEIIQSEVFGPVITVSAFDGEAQALRLRQRRALRPGGLGLYQGCRPRHAPGAAAGVWHRLDQRPHPAGIGRRRTAASSSRALARISRPKPSATTRSPSTS